MVLKKYNYRNRAFVGLCPKISSHILYAQFLRFKNKRAFGSIVPLAQLPIQ
jgi:hypothetical protein